jgi:hypothetical protein
MYEPQKHDAADMERRMIAKAVRSAVRLHYSMAADRAINELLAPILERHALCAANGQEFTLNLADLDLPALPEGN